MQNGHTHTLCAKFYRMDATTLHTFLIPILTVTSVWNTEKLVTYICYFILAPVHTIEWHLKLENDRSPQTVARDWPNNIKWFLLLRKLLHFSFDSWAGIWMMSFYLLIPSLESLHNHPRHFRFTNVGKSWKWNL